MLVSLFLKISDTDQEKMITIEEMAIGMSKLQSYTLKQNLQAKRSHKGIIYFFNFMDKETKYQVDLLKY